MVWEFRMTETVFSSFLETIIRFVLCCVPCGCISFFLNASGRVAVMCLNLSVTDLFPSVQEFLQGTPETTLKALQHTLCTVHTLNKQKG